MGKKAIIAGVCGKGNGAEKGGIGLENTYYQDISLK